MTGSLSGTAQAPRSKPPRTSSSGRPGACITPSSVTWFVTTTLLIEVPFRESRRRSSHYDRSRCRVYVQGSSSGAGSGPMPESETDPVDVVRRGYDALSLRYRADDANPGRYGPWIAELLAVLKVASRILDLGCVCGGTGARARGAAGLRGLG